MKYSFHLQEILSEKNMTVREFSELAGIHYRTALNMYHNRTVGIQFDILYKACMALKVTPNELLHISEVRTKIKLRF